MTFAPAARSSTVEFGSRSMSVTHYGDGPPVVLLHGGGPGTTGRSAFARNIDALAHRFHLIVPDLPGFGESSKDLDRHDPFGDAATAVADLIQALGLQRPHLAGHSFGGAVALRLAMEHPTLLDRLLVIAPAGIDTSRTLPTTGLRELLGNYRGRGPSPERMDNLIRRYLIGEATRVTPELIDERYRASVAPQLLAHPPLRPPRSLSAVRALDLTRDQRLATIAAKTLAFWGLRDKVLPAARAHRLAAILPDCDLYLARGVGHWAHWEAAPTFNTTATAFFAR
ncbi:alpha/beta fold hydrolase [Nocardia yamanashiensis]|uniref:alpha/beta fold hydrolase n=1 Tax=Nocardia yamanashiensis TaxID=209247 RepID=UPI00083004AD|nr:alpha/beta fold hydrolase [Nocardia yamanashiensis]